MCFKRKEFPTIRDLPNDIPVSFCSWAHDKKNESHAKVYLKHQLQNRITGTCSQHERSKNWPMDGAKNFYTYCFHFWELFSSYWHIQNCTWALNINIKSVKSLREVSFMIKYECHRPKTRTFTLKRHVLCAFAIKLIEFALIFIWFTSYWLWQSDARLHKSKSPNNRKVVR